MAHTARRGSLRRFDQLCVAYARARGQPFDDTVVARVEHHKIVEAAVA
jgi:hypothetical protein